MKSVDNNSIVREVGRTRVRATCLVAILASLIAALSLSAGASARSSPQHITQQLRAGGYRLVLKIGPSEMMSMHGKTGERMLGGKSANCSMKGAQACNHHLELHVYKGKQVVRNARVTIAVIAAQRHFTMIVPVMTMVGAGKGMSDYHYGNNVFLLAGDYTVQVAVNSAAAAFGIHLM